MDSSDNTSPDFFTTLYEFRRHYEEKLFRAKRAIDNKNIGVLVDLQASSYEITEKTQKDLEEVVSLQHQADIGRATLDCLKAILNTKEDVQSLPEKAPDVLETLLWLLSKDETPFFKDQFKAAAQAAFGTDALGNLESLKDINAEELEETFKLETNKDRLTDYLAHIETLYIPEEGAGAPEQPDIPEDSKEMTKEVKAVSDYNLVTLKSFKNFAKPGEVNLKKDPYKSLNECIACHPTGKSAKISKNFTKVGEVKIPNKAVHFDFGQNGNNLKICTAKGDEKSNIDFYRQLNTTLKNENQHFADEIFPAKPTSITTDFVKYPNVPSIPWKTIPEVYSKKALVLCSDEISPNDINQGNLGNCFYLSALSALAEDKVLIQRLFQSKGISPTGCYSVWLCDSGEWKQILIDDYIPCDLVKGNLTPRFSRSKGNDIWVLLLEKAYAKLHGNYYVTSSGFQGEAFAVLTGAPNKYFLPKHRGTDALKNIWTFITEAAKNNFVITAAGRKETAVLKHKALGLVSGHAYAVLDAREVQVADGKTEKIVKMRNPWGTVEWKGDWSDASARWTPELLSSLNYLPKAMDGVFWINIADFDKYFSQLCVSQVIPENKFSFIRLGEGKKQNVFIAKMKIDTPGFVYLSVQQKRNKFFQGNPVYCYSFARIILLKTDEEGKITSFIHGKSKREQSVTIRRELEQGNYLVLIEVDWVQKFYNEVVLTAYAPMEVDIQEELPTNYNIEELYESVVRSCFASSSLTGIKTVQLKLGTKEFNATKSLLGIRFGLSATKLINQEKDATLYYKILVKTLDNFDVYLPQEQRGLTTILVRVPPGEERFIIFKSNMTNPKAQNSALNYGDTHTFRQEFTPEELKELCKEKGNKLAPIKDGNITLHTLSYMGGVGRFYTNSGAEGTFHDNMTFASDDLIVNGQETKTFEVVVGPGEEFLLDVKVKDPFAGAKMDRTSKARMTK